VREVQRETLGDENAYAMAGPMGGSPYAVAGEEAPVIGGLDNSMFDHMGDDVTVAQAAAAPMEESDAMYREEGLQSLSSSRGRGAGAVRKHRGKSADRDAERRAPRPSAARAPADDGMALHRLATEINKREGKVQIQGFARSGDGDPQNDARMRAERVRDQLVQLGVPAEKVEAEASGLVSDSQAVRVVTKDTDSKPSQSSTAEGSRTETIGNAYFVSGVPMTIEKDRSAMVSLLKSKAKAQRVYYYDPVSPRGSSTYAFQAVRMDNPSDQTLDRGPFTVYAEGQFLGEGLSDAIPPRGTAFVPYALDRQVVVDTKTKGTEEVHQLLAIERGVVHAEVHQIHETTFALHNRGEKPAKVYVRYAVAPGWELRAGDHKVERLGQDYLIAVDVPAHKNAELVVAQAQPAERSIDMRVSAGAASVEAYLKRTKALTPELRGQLEAVLGLYREMGDIEERKTTIAEQMVEYRTRVDEINMQLVTLRNVKTAGTLSAHLAKKMREISERLQQATIKSTDLQGELMACRIRMQDQLAELKLERASEKDKAIAAK
jgi:hypothetical protein